MFKYYINLPFLCFTQYDGFYRKSDFLLRIAKKQRGFHRAPIKNIGFLTGFGKDFL